MTLDEFIWLLNSVFPFVWQGCSTLPCRVRTTEGMTPDHIIRQPGLQAHTADPWSGPSLVALCGNLSQVTTHPYVNFFFQCELRDIINSSSNLMGVP